MIETGEIQQCKYPECRAKARATWALVPLCNEHQEIIQYETMKYYGGRIIGTEAATRPHYMKIAKLIPWSKLRLSEGGGEYR